MACNHGWLIKPQNRGIHHRNAPRAHQRQASDGVCVCVGMGYMGGGWLFFSVLLGDGVCFVTRGGLGSGVC